MPVSKSTKRNYKDFIKQYKWLLATTTAIVILVLFDLSPFGGNIRFYATWAKCGEEPLSEVVELGFGAQIPSYDQSNAFPRFRMQAKYFCTPLEAEQTGYSASPNQYEFPHLHKND